MFFPGLSDQVFIATGATDMRKSINGLSIMVADQLELNPLSGHLFCFCNRKRDIIKILHYALLLLHFNDKNAQREEYPNR